MSIFPGSSGNEGGGSVVVSTGAQRAAYGPGLVGGAIGLIGDYFSGRQASNERRHAEQRMLDMDNTKHQREVRDLRKAGLNPILSSTQGAASAGQVPGPAPVPDYGGTVSKAVASGLQAAMLKANLDNVNADTISKEAAARLTNATTVNMGVTTGKGLQETSNLFETGKNIRLQGEELQQKIRAGKISNDIAQRELNALLGEADAFLSRAAPNSWERKQLNDITKGDMTPATAIKLLLQLLGR